MLRFLGWHSVVILVVMVIPSNGTEDLYQVLGVSTSASTKEIRRAYKNLAKKWHPDKVQGEEAKEAAQKKFMAINAAHEILSDPEERRNYDDGQRRPKPSRGRQQFYHSRQGFYSQEDLFRHLFEQRQRQYAQWNHRQRRTGPVIGGTFMFTILFGGFLVMIYSLYAGNDTTRQPGPSRRRRWHSPPSRERNDRPAATPSKPKLDAVQQLAQQFAPSMKQVHAGVLAANERGKFLVLTMPLQSLMRRRGTWEMLAGVTASLSRDPMIFAWVHPTTQSQLATLLLKEFVHPIKRSLDPCDPEPCLLVLNPKRTKGTVLLCPRHEQSWNQPTLERWLTRLASGEGKWKTVKGFEELTGTCL